MTVKVIFNLNFMPIHDEQVWQPAFTGGHQRQMARQLGVVMKVKVILDFCGDLPMVGGEHKQSVISPVGDQRI